MRAFCWICDGIPACARTSVERRPCDRAAVALRQIAVRVVAVGGNLGPVHGRDRVRARKRAGAARAGAVGVGADVGLRGDVAERVVGNRNRGAARGPHRRGRHAVEQVAQRVELGSSNIAARVSICVPPGLALGWNKLRRCYVRIELI